MKKKVADLQKLGTDFTSEIKKKVDLVDKKKADTESPKIAGAMFSVAERYISAGNGVRAVADIFKSFLGVLKQSIENINRSAKQKVDDVIKTHSKAFFSQQIYNN